MVYTLTSASRAHCIYVMKQSLLLSLVRFVSDSNHTKKMFLFLSGALETLRQLDISNCMVTQQILPYVRKLKGLRDLRISNRVLEDLAYSCGDGQSDFTEVTLTQIDKVAVEHENAVQVNSFSP